MLLRRSGALSRFLVYRAPEFWARPDELVFFNVIFGFVPLAASFAVLVDLGGAAARELFDPLDPLPFSRSTLVEESAHHLLVARLAASRAGRVSLLGFAAVLGLICLWRLVAARPFTAALTQRLRQPLVPTFAPRARLLVLATPLPVLAGLWCAEHLFAVEGAYGSRRGWELAHLAGLCCMVVAVGMWDRRVALGASMGLVEAIARPPLDRARDGEALGVDATVSPEAPLVTAPLDHALHAHWVVSVTRVFKSGQNYSSQRERDSEGPVIVPIRGDGGTALLDLTHVVADLRAVRRVASPREIGAGKHRSIVGPAPVAKSSYVLEERFLDRGEAIHVIGRVVRFDGSGGGSVPVIGGTAAEPVIVHAGSRRSLLHGLSIERRFVTAGAALCAALTLAVAWLSGWLSARL